MFPLGHGACCIHAQTDPLNLGPPVSCWRGDWGQRPLPGWSPPAEALRRRHPCQEIHFKGCCLSRVWELAFQDRGEAAIGTAVSREALRVALSSQANAAPRAPRLWYQTGKVLGVAHDFAISCLWPLESQGLPLPTKHCLSSRVQSLQRSPGPLSRKPGAADGEPRALLCTCPLVRR